MPVAYPTRVDLVRERELLQDLPDKADIVNVVSDGIATTNAGIPHQVLEPPRAVGVDDKEPEAVSHAVHPTGDFLGLGAATAAVEGQDDRQFPLPGETARHVDDEAAPTSLVGQEVLVAGLSCRSVTQHADTIVRGRRLWLTRDRGGAVRGDMLGLEIRDHGLGAFAGSGSANWRKNSHMIVLASTDSISLPVPSLAVRSTPPGHVWPPSGSS
jgi:hypothetical protein